jgi:cytochrome oxidase Cu insertion factor (SCO1/SenC/PrrC family)
VRKSARRLVAAGSFLTLMGLTGGGLAQGVPALGFTPPAPGTYQLQRIQTAADGPVLDARGRQHPLHDFTQGRITLLAFVYSSCGDPAGCPYAYLIFNQVRDELEKDPALRGRVGLVSLSFDPEHDTPERMAAYGGENLGAGHTVRWDFLTTASLRHLLPLLDGFGQDVLVETDPATGRPTGLLGHVLKVFLIDDKGMVREIYTTTYLHPQVLLNDIRTLALEAAQAKKKLR